MTDTLITLGAMPCPYCHGCGTTRGLFHRIHCDPCAGVGYIQHENGQPVDLLAAGILSRRRRSSGQRHFETTPDTWTLRGNYRGD